MNILVLDMGTLAFRRESQSTVVVSAPGLPEVVRACVPDGCSDREAVFQALDAALGNARMAADGGWLPVALVNPASCEVAVGPVPRTLVFSDGDPIEVPAGGVLARFDDGALVLDGGRRLTPVDESVDAVERALVAQRH